MNFWKDGLSLDETKVSALVVSLIFCLIFAFGIYLYKGDISTNLVSVINTLIYSIAGVNSVNAVSNIIKGVTKNDG